MKSILGQQSLKPLVQKVLTKSKLRLRPKASSSHLLYLEGLQIMSVVGKCVYSLIFFTVTQFIQPGLTKDGELLMVIQTKHTPIRTKQRVTKTV